MPDSTSNSDSEAQLKADIKRRRSNARRTAFLLLLVVLGIFFTYIYMYCCES